MTLGNFSSSISQKNVSIFVHIGAFYAGQSILDDDLFHLIVMEGQLQKPFS